MARVLARLDRQEQQALSQARALDRVLQSAAQGSGWRCAGACLQDLRALPAAPRAFVQAHLALRRGEAAEAARHLAAALSRLPLRLLTTPDPSALRVSGQVPGLGRFTLERRVPGMAFF